MPELGPHQDGWYACRCIHAQKGLFARAAHRHAAVVSGDDQQPPIKKVLLLQRSYKITDLPVRIAEGRVLVVTGLTGNDERRVGGRGLQDGEEAVVAPFVFIPMQKALIQGMVSGFVE